MDVTAAPRMYVNARAFVERRGANETEVLVQVRDRPGSGGVLELPGGTLGEYEPILDGLAREVREETGLEVAEILDDVGRVVWHGVLPEGGQGAEYECLRTAFVYQTLRGAIDSIGFFFRCHAEGTLTGQGDLASGHRWLPVSELRRMVETAPQTFSGLSQAALAFYLKAPQPAARPAPPELRGERVLLRPLRAGDAHDRQACGYDAEFERMLGHDRPASAVMSPEAAEQWYSGRSRQPICWAIEYGGRCVGTVGFVNLSERSRWATFSIEICDPALWSQGLGSEATRLALRHAFATLGLHRVELQVLSYNQRAIRAYEKCGFVREGTVRECRQVDGEWIDDVSMSILDREYRADAS
jgi:RimJ/RimL family protein N-acetyltransferase/8-oxo-dGTP pyrophosphatase MutT (NUDIX family)